LVVYTFLAMHSVAYDQLLPIFMHYPVQSRNDPAVHLPFKFAGGFDIDSKRIGLLFTVYGISGMLVQFFIFPSFARRYGVLNCLKACTAVFPFTYIATPFTALLPTDSSRQGVMLVIMLIKGFAGIFAFPCSTILLTNSAASLSILGTLNGVATSVSAMGRAAGPALAGATFTWGVDIGYLVISWWVLAFVGVVGAIPVWMLREMEGFGGAGDDDSDEEEEDEEEIEEDQARQIDQVLEQDAQASAVTLGHAHSRKPSLPTIPNDVFDEDDNDQDAEQTSLLVPTVSRTSRGSQRQSLDLRRIPSPIGLGPGVVPHGARRYSSDLGATRSGLGTGGTTFQ
jgi:hypothetical protein